MIRPRRKKLTGYKWLSQKGANPVRSYVDGARCQVSLLRSPQSLLSAVDHQLLAELAGEGDQDRPEEVTLGLLVRRRELIWHVGWEVRQLYGLCPDAAEGQLWPYWYPQLPDLSFPEESLLISQDGLHEL